MRVERVAPLGADDRAELLDLWVRTWAATMPAIDFRARRAWFAAHLDALLGGGAMLLLVRDPDGAAAGFLTLQPETGEVDQLAVDPGQAGRGCGRALLEEAKRLGPGRLRLAVNRANGRAVRFYARAGFGIEGEATNPRSGLPVWLMTWPAPP